MRRIVDDYGNALCAGATHFASAIFDALAFVSALALRLPPDAQKDALVADKAFASFWRDTVDGWRWALSSRTIVSAVVLIGFVQFGMFGLYQAINLSLVARGTEPIFISLANVGTAMGTIVGSVISAKICNRVPVGVGVVWILVAIGAAYVPMVISDAYPVIVFSACLASLPMPLFSALVSGFVFSKTPVSKQGRTRAAIMVVLMFFASFSGAVAGELLPRIGFSGFVVVLIGLSFCGAAFAILNARIRAIPASPEWEKTEL